MPSTMVVLYLKTCTLNHLDEEDRTVLKQSLLDASLCLATTEHDPLCPVASGASCDCTWPFEVCVPASWKPPLALDVVQR